MKHKFYFTHNLSYADVSIKISVKLINTTCSDLI